MPIKKRAMADGQYVQLLRLRLGVPCIMPPAQWRCNCTSLGDPASLCLRGERCRTRSIRPPTGPVSRPVLQAPLEERHDSIRDSLARTLELGLFKAVRATVKLRVPNPQTGVDRDIKVHQCGTTWILDVSVVCPGTQRYVDRHPRAGSRGLRSNQGGEVRRSAQLRPIHRGDRRPLQQAGTPLCWYTCTQI
jgi:hypothetical protein